MSTATRSFPPDGLRVNDFRNNRKALGLLLFLVQTRNKEVLLIKSLPQSASLTAPSQREPLGAARQKGPLCEGDSPQCGEMSRSDRGVRPRKRSREAGGGESLRPAPPKRPPCVMGDSPQCGEMSRSDRGDWARRAPPTGGGGLKPYGIDRLAPANGTIPQAASRPAPFTQGSL